jgi:biopolymer transport protein ExbB/TolQ
MDLNDYFIVFAMLILAGGVLYALITNAMFKMRRELMDQIRKTEIETMRLQNDIEQQVRTLRDDFGTRINGVDSNVDHRLNDVYSMFNTHENRYNQMIQDLRSDMDSRVDNMYRVFQNSVSRESLIHQLENCADKKSIREMVEKHI